MKTNVKDLINQVSKETGLEVIINHYRFSNEDVKRVLDMQNSLGVPKNRRGKIADKLQLSPLNASMFPDRSQISPLGGVTEVVLSNGKGEEFFGSAHCSMVDNFNRHNGIVIAIGRARKEFQKANEIKNKLQ